MAAIGDRQAFPCDPDVAPPGMTYRQYLIAQALPAAMKFARHTPTSGNPGESSAFFNEASEIAVLAADSVLLLLETEQQMKKDDEGRKEKPDGPAA